MRITLCSFEGEITKVVEITSFIGQFSIFLSETAKCKNTVDQGMEINDDDT